MKIQNNFFLYPTDVQEISDDILNINPHNSAGSDNMSPKFIIPCNNILSNPISHIINLSFENSKSLTKLNS